MSEYTCTSILENFQIHIRLQKDMPTGRKKSREKKQSLHDAGLVD